MPWKPDRQNLPGNYEMALKRLENTEKRLVKDKEVRDGYVNTIKDYIAKGYVSEVDSNSTTEFNTWILRHFPLVKPDRKTTKLRITFDASAKHRGVCLNDVSHKGPKLQRNQFSVLLRFRRFPFALVGDIAEMYLRTGIDKDSRHFHRFLWRDLQTWKRLKVYQFNSLVFGLNSCPFQAQFVSRHHTELNKEQFPKAAETVQVQETPVTAFRRCKNLKDLLVRARLATNNNCDERGCTRCEKSRCQVCKSMSERDSFYSPATSKEYKINFSFNCDSSGVVYLFDYVVCGVQYVGSTNTPFRLRFNNYKACYRRFRSGSSIPQMDFFRHFLRKDIMGSWKTFVSL